MTISIFDLFSIGVGPSSSHTVGPMRAANMFLKELETLNLIDKLHRVRIDLFGSLALTGKGHGTDYAVLMGLSGNTPEGIDPVHSHIQFDDIKKLGDLVLNNIRSLAFDYEQDLIFHYDKVLPHHANGLSFTVVDKDNKLLLSKTYYSIGGGFVVTEESFTEKTKSQNMGQVIAENSVENNDELLEPIDVNSMPHKFCTAEELLHHCEKHNKTIAEVMMSNELFLYKEKHGDNVDYSASNLDKLVKKDILNIWSVMDNCIQAGIKHTGILPGGLNVRRRAADLYKKIVQAGLDQSDDVVNNTLNKKTKPNPHIDNDMNWLSLYAIAVNEENAAGGRVVTAPTNGAAGVIPAVLKFYTTHPDCDNDKIVEFLLTAAAICILYKERASISAAEVGCQGEVGVACSMAAAAYAAVLGGSIYQVENAAEIGMEHHLGLTCDPINGLVQIPCIERNAAGAVQAINCAQLALLGDGQHYVSLDKVINTMRQTGHDMMSKYKETSQGGLAVNLPEC